MELVEYEVANNRDHHLDACENAVRGDRCAEDAERPIVPESHAVPREDAVVVKVQNAPIAN